jgi:RNA polymerase sigma-70 factor, ECF subfamily
MDDVRANTSGDDAGTITQLLQRWRGGDETALAEVMRVIYADLRRLAANHMRRERGDHTLQPTALVAETYLRLCGEAASFENRSHFLAVASRSMRHVLVDHARAHAADKRGNRPIAVAFDDDLLTTARPDAFLALDDALTELATLDERQARIVELVYFGGLGQVEVAELLQVHFKTVARDLRLARAWLKTQIE